MTTFEDLPDRTALGTNPWGNLDGAGLTGYDWMVLVRNAGINAEGLVGGGGTWGSITGTLSAQTDLQTALNAKADSSSLGNSASRNVGTTTGTVAAGDDARFISTPVSIANGGTGAATQQAALDAVAGAVTSGQYLRGNGTHVGMSAIQAGDVPTLNQNTTGTAAGLSATLAVGSGGTGSTTAQGAMDTIAGAVTSGSYLRGNGTHVTMSAIQAGDVPTLNQNTTGTAAGLSATLAVGSGGTGATTLTAHGVVVGNGSSAVAVTGAGTSGQVLTSNGASADPTFQSANLSAFDSGSFIPYLARQYMK